jgi:hypothetical protein
MSVPRRTAGSQRPSGWQASQLGCHLEMCALMAENRSFNGLIYSEELQIMVKLNVPLSNSGTSRYLREFTGPYHLGDG